MAKYEPKALRNVAIVGHGGTGKTTLCESFLYISGKTDRPGRVDEGTSCMDFEPEEQKKRISISSSINFVEWNKHKINIIDTPGDSNFAFDTLNCLRIADSALIVVDAVAGVEFQTEAVWEYADRFHLPRILYVNRMDRERADFPKTLESIKAKLGRKPTPLVIPVGQETDFKGVVDLLSMKAFLFDDSKGTSKAIDIPQEIVPEAEKFRESLVEDIAESDEELMNKYLEGGTLSPEELNAALRNAVVSGAIVPVACGAPLQNIAVSNFLDIIISCLPSPLDRGPVSGKKPGTGESEERKPDPSQPFSAFVFKTIADPYAGKLTLFRVYSGKTTADAGLYNPSKKIHERVGSLFFLEGKTQKPTDELVAGEIAAVAKLKETATGDTLCFEKAPILFEKLTPPPAIMTYAVEPKSRGDEDKIVSSINRLIEEDPSLSFSRSEETKEMLLSGMGQIHIEIAVEKMKRKFGLELTLKTPKVPYKETIKGKTTIQGKYKKQSGGRGQYGDAWLEIEPLPRGSGFEFADRIVGGVVPQQYRPAVEKGIIEAMAEGILAGYPVVDLKVSLIDGTFHTVDSSEMAFKIAGSMGFKKGVLLCHPTILEPIVNIEIEIPEEYMGDVIGDLNSRRGKVIGMDTKGTHQIIKGQVPLAETLKYAPDLRSMTSGRGTFTYSFSHYEEAPAYVAEKIIAESKKGKEED